MKWSLAFLAALSVAAAPAARAERLEMFNNRLFVDVVVNGVPTRALLDSAAEMTILDDDFAERLSLAAHGSATARGSGAKSVEARFADGVEIAVAGTRIDPRVAILDLDEVANRLIGRPVALLLGREIFDSRRLRIDIDQGVIEEAAPGPGPGAELAVSNAHGVPLIPVTVNGDRPASAVFDLGNGSEILIGRAFAERLGLAGPEAVVERRAGGGLGGGVERAIVLIPRLNVAGRDYVDVEAAIDEGEAANDLNIGTSILRDFLITTDFAGGRIWLQKR